MQALLVAVLAVGLGTCMAMLLAMGAAQRRRRRQLARLADRCGLRFSWRDPFGLVQRYGACRLMQAGHSGYVDGVLHGQFRGWNVRMFDFHFEVGHGPRRLVRRYCVIASELPEALGPAFVWRGGDKAMAAPLPSARRLEGDWYGSGDAALSRAVCRAWGSSRSVIVECVGRLALFATGDRLSGVQRLAQLSDVVDCLEQLAGAEHCISPGSMLEEIPIVEPSTPTRRSDQCTK
ncbi:MAG: hypothetical protein GX591_03105 [Planctomycetes bacterium]|nr:hypothetical protein [Planctomycetota bacterium]